MPRTGRLATAAVCAALTAAATVLPAGPAAAVDRLYDCETRYSGAPYPDFEDVTVYFTNTLARKLVISTLGMPTDVDLPIGYLSATAWGGPSPFSLTNVKHLYAGDELEVQTVVDKAIPLPLPTEITFTVNGPFNPIDCVR
ncbi:hypothetical protein [Yinghuangia soli]|uniref:Uncharacterized protein n=1 Tax=Yinghuangia soli TaxID=2908204 RepID=A0AA41Q6L4_9ACTN|nr:hypothetical protein [Yinghuangia soli]MCF2532463.1 hypothetical protein [Yinghuangia soli]